MYCYKGVNIEQKSMGINVCYLQRMEREIESNGDSYTDFSFFLIYQVNRIEGRLIRVKRTLHSSKIQSCELRNFHLGKFASHSSNFYLFFTFHRLIDDREKKVLLAVKMN